MTRALVTEKTDDWKELSSEYYPMDVGYMLVDIEHAEELGH